MAIKQQYTACKNSGAQGVAQCRPMRNKLKRLLPSPQMIQNNRWLRWMGPTLAHPRLWHMSRKGIAAGLALGLFFGLLVPVAQIPFAAGAAVLLRANLPVAVGSTLITNPVTFGPVYFGAYKLGHWVLHRGDEHVNNLPTVLPPALLKAQLAKHDDHELTWIEQLQNAWHRLSTVGKPLVIGLAIVATLTGILVYLLTSWIWALMIWLKRRKRLRAVAYRRNAQ
ncbi:MAG: DUF2062 domain-containing protein [Burkholderiaceae bacterium]